MKTDDLIEMLGTHVEPVDRRTIMRTVGIAIGAGGLAALALMLLLFGVRADVTSTRAWLFCVAKLAFTLALVVPAFVYLTRLARPGGERTVSVTLLVAPFIAAVLVAAGSLAVAPRAHWDTMIAGERWLECVLSIPIIAIVPFATIIWALRQTAPTDLVRAGALGGLLAGAISATGYALHCMDDSVPFVALWYGGAIVACTIVGAVLGPRLLRW